MASWLLCTRPYKRVSSANSLSVEHMPFPMSFIYSKKQRGPKMEWFRYLLDYLIGLFLEGIHGNGTENLSFDRLGA